MPSIRELELVPYHGTPITPDAAAVVIMTGRHAMVSFAHPQQMELMLEICQSVAADSGAYSAWRSGKSITDWLPFRRWIDEWSSHPGFDWFLIPDVIDGDERDNDQLIYEFREVKYGVPVWHMHETTQRLKRLMDLGYERIALGSSGEFSVIGNERWWGKMAEAMDVVCDDNGRPLVKLHGLRMLDPKIFGRLPLASADSTNVARNVGIDSRWRGTYLPHNKATRGIVLANRIESYGAAPAWINEVARAIRDFERAMDDALA